MVFDIYHCKIMGMSVFLYVRLAEWGRSIRCYIKEVKDVDVLPLIWLTKNTLLKGVGCISHIAESISVRVL